MTSNDSLNYRHRKHRLEHAASQVRSEPDPCAQPVSLNFIQSRQPAGVNKTSTVRLHAGYSSCRFQFNLQTRTTSAHGSVPGNADVASVSLDLRNIRLVLRGETESS